MPKSRTHAKVISSKEVYRGPLFHVTSDQIIEPSGIKVRRDIVRHNGSVVVLALDESRQEPRILLEKQYRYTADDYLWELPAGKIDKGEKPLEAGQRELLEETGYAAASWKRILHFYASPGFVAEPMSLFLARGLRPGEAQPEADEVIRVKFVPVGEAVRMVMSGRIRDAKTISGILWVSHTGNASKPHK